jgi:hypothetical protein
VRGLRYRGIKCENRSVPILRFCGPDFAKIDPSRFCAVPILRVPILPILVPILYDFVKGNPENVIALKPLINANKQLSLPIPELELDNQELFKILTVEFGVSNNKAAEILKSRDELYIEEVLESVRGHIEKGVVQNIPAFTVKAIEEDYRRKTPKVEIEKEARKKNLAAEKEAEVVSQKQQEDRDQEMLAAAMARYEKMERAEKEVFLAEFREYLVATGNRIVVSRFDQDRIAPGAVEAMFWVFVKERM